jgi:hypothetical protein
MVNAVGDGMLFESSSSIAALGSALAIQQAVSR